MYLYYDIQHNENEKKVKKCACAFMKGGDMTSLLSSKCLSRPKFHNYYILGFHPR